MKKFAVSAALVLAVGLSCLAFPAVPAEVSAEESGGTWTADGTNNMTNTEAGVNFRPGGTYRYSEPIDLENEGFSMSMTVGGEFRREDSWFALMLTKEYSSEIGEYGGVSIQFKPVSTQGVESGSMPAYVSLYTLGTAEGGSSASSLATVNASDIPERETPYTFNFSIFIKDGTWVIGYGIDTYTYTWSYAGLDLSDLKASLVFGGADVSTTDMNVTVTSFGSALKDGLMVHAAEAEPDGDGVRIRETSKRQGKVFYPVTLSSDKEISVKFKINNAPGWYVNDNGFDAWFGISLTSSPNMALPGSSTFSTIIRAHEKISDTVQHIGGFFFLNGADIGGFSEGVNTRPQGTGEDEYNELIYKIEDGAITVTLTGATSRTQTVQIGSNVFPQGVAYLSFAFHDAQYASIIERNEFGEEIGRHPNPDVSYWDVTLGEISEYGAPTVQADGKRVNTVGDEHVRIPVELYGGSIQTLEYETEDGFSQISVSDYAVTADGDNAVIVLTDGFTQRLGLGEHTFRLTTSHPIAAYDDLQTTFTVTFVEAETADVAAGSGTYRASAYNDVRYSFTLRDDTFVALSGYGVTASDYFYNPVTGNLYLKREFCKNLVAGEYEFDVEFEFGTGKLSLTVVNDAAPEGEGGADVLVISLSVAGGVLVLAAVAAVVIVVCKKKAKKTEEAQQDAAPEEGQDDPETQDDASGREDGQE